MKILTKSLVTAVAILITSTLANAADRQDNRQKESRQNESQQ
jgi:hypothetical protein